MTGRTGRGATTAQAVSAAVSAGRPVRAVPALDPKVVPVRPAAEHAQPAVEPAGQAVNPTPVVRVAPVDGPIRRVEGTSGIARPIPATDARVSNARAALVSAGTIGRGRIPAVRHRARGNARRETLMGVVEPSCAARRRVAALRRVRLRTSSPDLPVAAHRLRAARPLEASALGSPAPRRLKAALEAIAARPSVATPSVVPRIAVMGQHVVNAAPMIEATQGHGKMQGHLQSGRTMRAISAVRIGLTANAHPRSMRTSRATSSIA